MVTEILKHRTNRGETAGLYFYRDAQQREVDAVIESPGRFTLVEAKSGETIGSKSLDPVRAVAAVLAKRGDIESLTVIGGGVGQRRSDVSVVPWNELHRHAATLARSK